MEPYFPRKALSLAMPVASLYQNTDSIQYIVCMKVSELYHTHTHSSSDVTIGFEQTTYNTTEGVPTEACAVVLSDQLEKTVVVSVSSSNDTATGIYLL